MSGAAVQVFRDCLMMLCAVVVKVVKEQLERDLRGFGVCSRALYSSY